MQTLEPGDQMFILAGSYAGTTAEVVEVHVLSDSTWYKAGSTCIWYHESEVRSVQ